MADLIEAFNTLKFQKNQFQVIDFFFTQRTLSEDHEYIDKNMNRKNKKVKVIHNLLGLNIVPLINNEQTSELDIEVFGDEGYYYKGKITSVQGNIPNLLILVKKDKKFLTNIICKINDNIKRYVNFIEVPKRFQFNEVESIIESNNE
jgi:hypothetical protein